MSTLSDCCNPCATVTTTNIPGAQGPAGATGAAGADGIDSVSIVQAPGFTIPTVGNDVLIPVNSTAWMAVGQVVICSTGFGGPVTGPANFLIITLNTATSFTGRALAYPGDAVNPTAIAASAIVSASGKQGAAGTAGATFPTTTKGDTMFDDGTNAPLPSVVRKGIGAQGQAIIADPSNGTVALVLAYKGVAQTLFTNFGSAATGADTTEDNLMSFTVPLNTLRNTNDSLEWEAYFDVTSTASNATKLIKVYLGGTGGSVIGQYGPAAAIVQDGGKVVMRGRVLRVSNVSQKCFCEILTTDGTGPPGASVTFVSTSTPNQDLTTNLLFVCTGKNGSAFANGIVQQSLVLNYRAA